MIGFRERIRRQRGALGPAHLLPLLGTRVAVERAVEEDAYRLLRVGPGHRLDQATHRGIHAELFLELAAESRLGRLRGADLPAGKLPEARQVRAFEPTGDEVATVALDYRGNHIDDLGHGPARRLSTRRRWE